MLSLQGVRYWVMEPLVVRKVAKALASDQQSVDASSCISTSW